MPDKSDLPSFEKYFPPAVQSMRQRGGSTTIEELEEDVAKIMKLSESILSIPHKNGTRSQFQYELAWVRTYLKKAGLADNSARGVWSLTDAGEKISDKELLSVPKKVRWLKKAKDEQVQPHLDSEEDGEATRDGAPAIDLVDGEAICALLKDLKLGVIVNLVEEVQVEPKFFSAI
jgi:restriction system protein